MLNWLRRSDKGGLMRPAEHKGGGDADKEGLEPFPKGMTMVTGGDEPTVGDEPPVGDVPPGWDRLEQVFGIRMKGLEVFQQAMRHRSARDTMDLKAHETYERIEFLGDALLGLVTAEYLYRRFPGEAEGFLTKLRSKIVKKDSLALLAEEIGLVEVIEIGERSRGMGIESSRSVLSDMFESFIGAVYLAYGFDTASRVIRQIFETHLDMELLSRQTDNYKSMLLEHCQSRRSPPPVYRVVGENGPGHDRTFLVEVDIDGKLLGQGRGKSKKQAEQSAARSALANLSGSG